jgi:formate dehydrogenase alpha subunit
MEMNVKDGRIFRITTDAESHNHGVLCVGGRFGFDFTACEARLNAPLIRRDGELRPVFWETAISYVTDNLKKIIAQSGPDSVVGLASPRLTNEDCYAFQKFFRVVVGTNNIDSEARFGYLRVLRAFELTTGRIWGAPNLDELLNTDAMLVIGTDPLEETPALGWKIKLAARRYDANVVTVNSRATGLDPFARVRLRIRPYTEGDLILGLMKVILDLNLWDDKFVRDYTANFVPMKKLLDKLSLKGVLRRTGVAAEDLEEAAKLLGEAPRSSIIFGGDVILQRDGLQCVMNLVNLSLLTGAVEHETARLYPIVEKGNTLGLCEMGVLPEYLPGYQDAAVARGKFERIWKAHLPYTRGKTVLEMSKGLETGEIRAVYIAGADPVTDYPNASRFSAALSKAELLVVQDIFLSPTAGMAHCVLPAASFAEREGLMTNIEHRIQRLNQAIPPLGATMPDWTILEEVAKGMGRSMGFFNVSDVFREMTLTIPHYSGLRLGDLAGDGKVVEPVIEGREGARTGKRYSFAPVRAIETADPEADRYPFELIAVRSMYHFGSTTTRSKNLSSLCNAGYLEISADDAKELNISEGDEVTVTSKVGAFTAPAKVSTRVPRGIVSAPTNFPELGVYRLFSENTTVCRVQLSAPHRGG